MTTIVPSQSIDYTTRVSSNADTYLYRQLQPNNQLTTIARNGLSTISFDVPNVVHNLSKSYIQFTMTLAAEAAYVLTHLSSLPFESVTLTSASGKQLAYCPALTLLSKWSNQLTTSSDDWNTAPGLNQNFSTGAVVRSNSDINVLASQLVRPDGTSVENGVVPYASVRRMTVSNNGAALVIPFRFFLEDIPWSVFQMPQNVIFGEMVRIQFNFAPASRFTWLSAANNGTAPGNRTSDTTITVPQFMLAVQSNPDVIARTMQMYAAGELRFQIPAYVYQTENAGNVTSYTRHNRIVRGDLQKIRTIFNCFVLNGAVNMGQDNTNNSDLSKFSSSQRYMNMQPLQQSFVNTEEDRAQHQYLFRKSIIQSQLQLDQLGVFIDDFTGVPLVKHKEECFNLGSGLEVLPSGMDYWIQVGRGAAADLVYHMFAVGTKSLVIDPAQGVSVV